MFLWVPFLENSGHFSHSHGFTGKLRSHEQLHILTFGVYARRLLFHVKALLSGAVRWY